MTIPALFKKSELAEFRLDEEVYIAAAQKGMGNIEPIAKFWAKKRREILRRCAIQYGG